MAQSTQEIYDAIIAEKESGNYPELDELNSTSKVSIWRLWVWIFAFFSRNIEILFDQLKEWVISYFATRQVGTLIWWITELKKFQYGDELELISGVFQYATIDVEKQITSQAAIEEENKVLKIKVAKLVNEELSPFSSDEKLAIEGYISKIKLPGTFITVISQDAGELDLNLRIYYNPEISQTTIQSNTEAAIKDYLSSIVFNGKFVVNDMIDQLQLLSGVENPVFLSGTATEEFVAEPINIGDYYVSDAGFFKLNSVNIQFIANV